MVMLKALFAMLFLLGGSCALLCPSACGENECKSGEFSDCDTCACSCVTNDDCADSQHCVLTLTCMIQGCEKKLCTEMPSIEVADMSMSDFAEMPGMGELPGSILDNNNSVFGGMDDEDSAEASGNDDVVSLDCVANCDTKILCMFQCPTQLDAICRPDACTCEGRFFDEEGNEACLAGASVADGAPDLWFADMNVPTDSPPDSLEKKSAGGADEHADSEFSIWMIVVIGCLALVAGVGFTWKAYQRNSNKAKKNASSSSAETKEEEAAESKPLNSKDDAIV